MFYCAKHMQYYTDECSGCSNETNRLDFSRFSLPSIKPDPLIDLSIYNLPQSRDIDNLYTTPQVCTCGILTDKEKFEQLYWHSCSSPTFGQWNCPIHGKR